MMNIIDHMLLSREERRSHLALELPCVERGGKSVEFRGLLAATLGTTIPETHTTLLCHACNNEKCSNPNHLYWGTHKDNYIDRVDHTGMTLWEQNVAKNGYEAACASQSRGVEQARKAGKGNAGKPKSPEHRAKIAQALTGKKRSQYKQNEP
jgi:hypothetical protein